MGIATQSYVGWVQSVETVIISVAELPGNDIDPVIFDSVTKTMIHGSCGEYNLTCMRNGMYLLKKA